MDYQHDSEGLEEVEVDRIYANCANELIALLQQEGCDARIERSSTFPTVSGETPLVGIVVPVEQAEYARQLITMYAASSRATVKVALRGSWKPLACWFLLSALLAQPIAESATKDRFVFMWIAMTLAIAGLGAFFLAMLKGILRTIFPLSKESRADPASRFRL